MLLTYFTIFVVVTLLVEYQQKGNKVIVKVEVKYGLSRRKKQQRRSSILIEKVYNCEVDLIRVITFAFVESK